MDRKRRDQSDFEDEGEILEGADDAVEASSGDLEVEDIEVEDIEESDDIGDE
jgi:hypothetical protein